MTAGTVNGVTATIQADGSILLNGTCTGSANFTVIKTVKAGNYVLSCPYSGTLPSNSSSRVDAYNATAGAILQAIYNNDASGAAKTASLSVDSSIQFRIRVDNGHTYNNVVIYPQLEAGSTATAFSAYENICPISGWTGANIQRLGKNILPSDLTWTDGKYINDQGKEVVLSSFHYSSIFRIKPGTEYTCQYTVGAAASGSYILNRYDENMNNIGWQILISSSPAAAGTYSGTFTTPPNVAYARISTNKLYTNQQIEEGATATEYEANAAAVRVGWQDEAGTVYGGTLDVTTGLLTVNMALVDLGEEGRTWTYRSNFNLFTSPATNEKENGKIVCSSYRKGQTTTTDMAIRIGAGGYFIGSFVLSDSRFTDGAALAAALAGVQAAYEIATPQVYQLTPTEVKTLLGKNYIWADTGGRSVTYKADIQLYVEKMLGQ